MKVLLPTDKKFLEKTNFLKEAANSTITLPSRKIINKSNINFKTTTSMTREALFGALMVEIGGYEATVKKIGFDSSVLPD